MVHYKRKKNSRLRGSKTHGWGAMKKHRGAGNRGGTGNAGSGKRADSKKPSIWANLDTYFGKHGFKPKNSVSVNSINISYLEENLPQLVAKGVAKHESGAYVINLVDAGYNKLLSSGNITKKFQITVPYASVNAIAKIQEAGGSVTGLLPRKEKKQKKADAKKSSDE